MTNDLISRETDEMRKDAKIKTYFARIVVDGPVMNPYYSILWFDPSDRDYHIGYSSYSLMNVYDWLRDEFEITSGPFDNEPVVHGRWIERPFLLGTTHVCSKCGDYYGMPHGIFNFCPNCGAKMDMEECRCVTTGSEACGWV